jgi:hypothetical protein
MDKVSNQSHALCATVDVINSLYRVVDLTEHSVNVSN